MTIALLGNKFPFDVKEEGKLLEIFPILEESPGDRSSCAQTVLNGGCGKGVFGPVNITNGPNVVGNGPNGLGNLPLVENCFVKGGLATDRVGKRRIIGGPLVVSSTDIINPDDQPNS
uniref:Uncharacterized protein n=1 Tax=Cannabis sativa TaxID=3483 RepID=A0A803NYR6_CANSA